MKDKTRLVYQIYKKRREKFIEEKKKDKNNWCYWTWKSLQDLQLEHIWESENLEILGKKNFDQIVKIAVEKKEEEEWIEQMKKKPKLRLYRKLKKNKLSCENYIIKFFERGRRKQLTRIQSGTNHLRIERGRWVGERVEERVCNVCLCNEVEDEKHYLLKCSMYVGERTEMFEKIRQECSNTEVYNIEIINEEEQLGVLIGQRVEIEKEREKIQSIVMEYMRKANNIRKKYINK